MPEIIYMKKSEFDKMAADKLRAKYLKKTPRGYSKTEIKSMSDEDLLDMAYFLSEGSPQPHNDKEPDVIYRLIEDDPKEEFDEDIPW